MLKQRVFTAIVLLVVLAGVLLSPWPLVWPLFLALVSALTVWEWWRFAWPARPVVPVVAGLVMFLLLIWQTLVWNDADDGYDLFWWGVVLSSAIWILVVPFYLWRGDASRSGDVRLWAWFAPLALYATWVSLVLWYAQGGLWYLLSVLILVWIADIFAYFGGKRWGRTKLAVHISPGKTREGALVGLLGVVVWMLVTSGIDGSYAQEIRRVYGVVWLIPIGLLLGVVSIAGDLFESLLKRKAGIKDSSGLLPGHGGVYDRIDAVIAVVPVSFFIVTAGYLT